ncbi:hypothetical protein [Planococcus salinus]|uniref:hypothetical protein n=1 Tax=Planococcus salinus TaxID=1848460 RepID=UPI001314A42D|nr:hypothetical protein [Planococcus salinus]
MARIIQKDNQGNVYLFILLIFLSVITLRKVKRIEDRRKELTVDLLETIDYNKL